MKKLLGIVVLGYRILYLRGQLPDHPNHPKGRNPYAHIAICVKDNFNASYKDIPDEKFNEVIDYIEYLKQNPS